MKKTRNVLSAQEEFEIIREIKQDKLKKETIMKMHPKLTSGKYDKLSLKFFNLRVKKHIFKQLRKDPNYQSLRLAENHIQLKNKIQSMIRVQFKENSQYLPEDKIGKKMRGQREIIQKEVQKMVSQDEQSIPQVEQSQIIYQRNEMPIRKYKKITPDIKREIIRLKELNCTPKEIREKLVIDLSISTIQSIKSAYKKTKYILFESKVSQQIKHFFMELNEDYYLTDIIIGGKKNYDRLYSYIKKLLDEQFKEGSICHHALVRNKNTPGRTQVYRIARKIFSAVRKLQRKQIQVENPQFIDHVSFIEIYVLKYIQFFLDQDRFRVDESILRERIERMIIDLCSENSIIKHLISGQLSWEIKHNIFINIYEKITGERISLTGSNSHQQNIQVQQKKMIIYYDETDSEEYDDEEETQNYINVMNKQSLLVQN